jgi:hypothetical protein
MQNRPSIGILPRGAMAVHPRQPILVEAAGEASEDGGIGPLRRSRRLAGGPR